MFMSSSSMGGGQRGGRSGAGQRQDPFGGDNPFGGSGGPFSGANPFSGGPNPFTNNGPNPFGNGMAGYGNGDFTFKF